MNKDQLDRLNTLVGLKASMAQWGGAKPFDKITGFIDKALKELVEEIDGKPVAEEPPTITSPKGQTLINPDAVPPEEAAARVDQAQRELEQRSAAEAQKRQAAAETTEEDPEEVRKRRMAEIQGRSQPEVRR